MDFVEEDNIVLTVEIRNNKYCFAYNKGHLIDVH